MTDTVICCRDVSKIFGPDPARHLAESTANRQAATVLYVHPVCEVFLDIRRSEMLAVMGLSGSGKSTLERRLSRLIEITGGSVTEGQDIAKLSEAALIDVNRRKMGVVVKGMAAHGASIEGKADRPCVSGRGGPACPDQGPFAAGPDPTCRTG